MARKLARIVCLLALGLPSFCLDGDFAPGRHPPDAVAAKAATAAPLPLRTVFVVGDLADEDLVAFTANTAASGQPGVVLLDGPKSSSGNRAFLASFRPAALVPVGSFPDGLPDLEERLGMKSAPPLAWKRGPPEEWYSRAEQVVVCPPEPRRLLLQAACLAGVLRAPLWIHRADADDNAELGRRLAAWRTRRVLAAGAVATAGANFPSVHVVHLPGEEAVATLHRRHLRPDQPIATLVVTNPADTKKALGRMSLLAPLLALRQQAALLLTSDAGDDTAAIVRGALKHPRLQQADNLLLLADLQSIPMERRPNPVPGKDAFIEMEPLTPTGAEPYSFATGRLFHDDLGVTLLVLARQTLLAQARQSPRKALVVSNPSGGLPLLEMFSRRTAWELRNSGYETTPMFCDDVCKDKLRRLLPAHDLFLWEGHHNTLIKEYQFADWTEALPPSFIFLQSCLALTDVKTHHLFERGSVSVVGSSTRIYSATGGAFALAYFNALLHDGKSLGGSLRQAKNFLLAYALLKEKRLGKEAKLTGANHRSAWAFTLWGDPTLTLPAPPAPAEAQAAVGCSVRGNTISFTLPATTEKIHSQRYELPVMPNTYLAGLVRPASDAGKGKRKLVPFLFAEVALPKARPHQLPRLSSRLPASNYVFCWDARRRTGYLLVAPRSRDQRELRFHIDWEPASPEYRVQGAD